MLICIVQNRWQVKCQRTKTLHENTRIISRHHAQNPFCCHVQVMYAFPLYALLAWMRLLYVIENKRIVVWSVFRQSSDIFFVTLKVDIFFRNGAFLQAYYPWDLWVCRALVQNGITMLCTWSVIQFLINLVCIHVIIHCCLLSKLIQIEINFPFTGFNINLWRQYFFIPNIARRTRYHWTHAFSVVHTRYIRFGSMDTIHLFCLSCYWVGQSNNVISTFSTLVSCYYRYLSYPWDIDGNADNPSAIDCVERFHRTFVRKSNFATFREAIAESKEAGKSRFYNSIILLPHNTLLMFPVISTLLPHCLLLTGEMALIIIYL